MRNILFLAIVALMGLSAASNYYSDDSGSCCCSSGFILAAIGGVALLGMNKKA